MSTQSGDAEEASDAPESGGSCVDSSFPSTNWSEIRRIAADDPATARAALERWLARYWRPLSAFFRRSGLQPADAMDLTQQLLVDLIEQQALRKVRPDSNLRRWLLRTAVNFRIDANRRANAKKRRIEASFWYLSELEDEYPYEQNARLAGPADVFQAAWRRTVLRASLERVRAECRERQQETDLEVFWSYFVEPLLAADGLPERMPTWNDVACRFGLESAREATRRAAWVRRRWLHALREEIRGYVYDEEEVEDELRSLLS